jgi:hypothetical protein
MNNETETVKLSITDREIEVKKQLVGILEELRTATGKPIEHIRDQLHAKRAEGFNYFRVSIIQPGVIFVAQAAQSWRRLSTCGSCRSSGDV